MVYQSVIESASTPLHTLSSGAVYDWASLSLVIKAISEFAVSLSFCATHYVTAVCQMLQVLTALPTQ